MLLSECKRWNDAVTTDATLEPVDKLAAIVTQKASWFNRHDYESSPGQKAMASRIQTSLQQRRKSPVNGAKNYIGQRRGRVTVVYYAGCRKDSQMETIHYWLVRCICGTYEIRLSRSLAKNKGNDACDKCKHDKWLQYIASIKH